MTRHRIRIGDGWNGRIGVMTQTGWLALPT
jgi:hypothetical protein